MERTRRAIEPHAWSIDGALFGIAVALYARGAGALDNLGLVITLAGIAGAAAFAIIPAESARRQAEREEHELEALRRGALRFVAKAAREILLESSLYIDLMESFAATEAFMADPPRFVTSTSWSVEAILQRGEEALDSAPLSDLGRGVTSHVGQLSGVVGPYDGSLDTDARIALARVLEVAARAASEALDASHARYQVRETRAAIGPQELEPLEAAYRERRGAFFAALQWLVGTVEQVESLAGPTVAEQWEAQQRNED